MATESFDIVVLGGGSAGLVVAGGAAQLGARTLLIEKHKLGGECLWTGCVPSKAFIRAARLAADVRRAPDFGIEIGYERVDFARVIDRVWEVIRQIEPHDSPEHMQHLGVEVAFGDAHFTGPHTLELEGRSIHSRYVTVATGSSALLPPIPGLREAEPLTNQSVFEQRILPRRLAVIGGGPIGLELGQSFARFGAEVTVVEMLDEILPKEDPELASALRVELEREGVRFLLRTQVRAVERSAGGKVLLLARAGDAGDSTGAGAARASATAADATVADATVASAGSAAPGDAPDRLEVDAILVAVGRRPNLEGLALEAAGVRSEHWGIPVDRRMRTNVSHIYACGDVTGRHPFTHAAEHQAKTVVMNAVLGLWSRIDERVIPWATFTEPELAHVGVTEEEARAAGRRFTVYRFPMDRVDRAITDGATAGLIKVVATPWRGTILGAHILGDSAGELIAEFALAMQRGVTVSQITSTVHVYPTLALGNRRAADQSFARFLRPSLVRWIRRLRRFRGRMPAREPGELL